jgi:hypothetical protein
MPELAWTCGLVDGFAAAIGPVETSGGYFIYEMHLAR